MASGYKVKWTDHALAELATTFNYLEENFTDKELNKLAKEIDKVLSLISKNPKLFPLSKSKGIRKAVIKKFNTMYYWEKNEVVEILSFFSNRQASKEL